MATVKTLKETKGTTATGTATPKPETKKKDAPPETKDAKFKRLATKRVKVILKQLSGLGNLGNRNAYAYTDAQIETIFAKLEGAVRDSKAKFSKGGEKKDFHIEL